MKKRLAAAVLAALAIAAIPFLLAGSLPLPGLDSPFPALGGEGLYIFETISLVDAAPAVGEARA